VEYMNWDNGGKMQKDFVTYKVGRLCYHFRVFTALQEICCEMGS
jgi:hypothetical protein